MDLDNQIWSTLEGDKKQKNIKQDTTIHILFIRVTDVFQLNHPSGNWLHLHQF